jgi:hypothetical protein
MKPQQDSKAKLSFAGFSHPVFTKESTLSSTLLERR